MASAVMSSLATSPLAQDPLSIKALLEDIVAGKGLYQTYKDDYPDLSHQHEDIIMELLSGRDDELACLHRHVEWGISNSSVYERVRAHCLFYYQFTNFICKPDDLNFSDKILIKYATYFKSNAIGKLSALKNLCFTTVTSRPNKRKNSESEISIPLKNRYSSLENENTENSSDLINDVNMAASSKFEENKKRNTFFLY